MTIEPDTWLYPGYKVSAPENASTEKLAGFARQYALWAEAKLEAERKLQRLNGKVSREGA